MYSWGDEPDAVIMPGTGMDETFVTDTFDSAVTAAGGRLVAVTPQPGRLVAGYVDALDEAWSRSAKPLVVGGVSIGGAVAAHWTLRHPERVAALIVSMPAWTGSAGDAPAAASANATADMLRTIGLEATVSAMSQSSPPWLATMLTRSWRAQWPDLPLAFDAAAAHRSPTPYELGGLTVPTAVVAASDDPLHPLAVAREWCDALPDVTMTSFSLSDLGRDPTIMGRLAVDALRS